MELAIVSAPPPLASRPPVAGSKRSVPSPPSAPPPTIPATRLGPPPAPPERVRSFLQHGFGRIRAAGNEGVHAPRFCVACVVANLLMMLVEFGVNGWRIEPLSTNWSIGVSAETLVRLGAKVTSYIVWRGEWWCAAWASNPRAAEEGPVIGSSRARVPVGAGGCSRRRGCMEASFTCSSTSRSSGSSARPWSARAAAGGMGLLACPRRGPICKPAGPRDSARSCCILASLDAAAASEPRLRPPPDLRTPPVPRYGAPAVALLYLLPGLYGVTSSAILLPAARGSAARTPDSQRSDFRSARVRPRVGAGRVRRRERVVLRAGRRLLG